MAQTWISERGQPHLQGGHARVGEEAWPSRKTFGLYKRGRLSQVPLDTKPQEIWIQ